MKKVQPDDHIVASIVSDFFDRNREYPTLTKITSCFNISIILMRLCCIRGSKKELVKLANQFHKELLKEIEDLSKDE